MRFLRTQRIVTGIIGGIIIMMLFGCASVKKVNIGQKYEDSKSWFKEKWRKVEAKFSASEDDMPSIEPHPENPDYLVYRTQWPHETLAGIADWFTGDFKNWKALAAANPEVEPRRIPAGTPLMIPAGLVKKKTLPTEDFAAKHRNYYFEHQVKWRGETLSLIAKWYTGRYNHWKALARANPGLEPNRIMIGDRICIPPEMMKTGRPLPRKVVAKTLSGYFAHTVAKTDEKLSDIAEWYTGDAGNAGKIASANPDIDPQLLLIGNEIYIPSSLLKTRKPLKHKSIQARTGKTTPQQGKTEAAAPASAREKKIQLFGPKQFPAQ